MFRRILAMLKASLFIILQAFAAPISVWADSQLGKPIPIIGELEIVDSHALLDGVSLTINDVNATVTASGDYSVSVPEADVYQIRFDGADIFTGIQTFAHVELEQQNKRTLSVPKIELVAKKPGRTEFIFGGDVMAERRYIDPRWNEQVLIRPESISTDMEKLFRPMMPYFRSADYAAINLETTLAEFEPAEKAPKSITFYTHPYILDALETLGIDYVSLGNNHTNDYLDEGIRTTLAALRESKIGFSGAGLNEAEALAPYRTNINGQKFSMLGYVGWKNKAEPSQVAEGATGGAAFGTMENIISTVSKEVADNRVTVVQYHGSREYSEEPTETTEVRLKAAVDAGADLVIGHHPHVSQGLELYNGKLIAWSLGNFLFDQFFYETHGAYALKVWMDGNTFYRAEVIPLQIKDFRPIPAMADTRRYVLQRVMALSALRGTKLYLSGGHAIVTSSNHQNDNPTSRTTHIRGSDNEIAKTSFPLKQESEKSSSSHRTALTEGRELFFRGDFETYGLLNLHERSWNAKNAKIELVRTPKTGRFALQVSPEEPGEHMQLGLKAFMRVLNQDSYSVSVWVKAEEDVEVSAYLQSRPEGMNRYKALEHAPFNLLGSKNVTGGEWTQVSFDFDIARDSKNRVLPSRPMFHFAPPKKLFSFLYSKGSRTIKPVLVDDFSFVEWQEE